MEMTNNLCNTCTNIGCEFQSGIVRTTCDFYMPPTVEAIPKDQYEARLKADIVSVLEEISLEIEELEKEVDSAKFAAGWICGTHDSLTVIKNRIDILKAVLKAKEKKDAT